MSRTSFKARLILEATISPTEDPVRVTAALGNVVGAGRDPASMSSVSARLITEDTEALSKIRDQLRDRHVRSAARRQLLLSKMGHTTSMMLNRQAAAAGVLAVCGGPEESPLGPIYLTISSQDLDSVIDWLTAYSDG